MRATPTAVQGAGIALILVTGAIHFIDAPSSFGDATYKGLLFLANGIAAIVAAVGIYRGERRWGWGLGALVAGGALVSYVISRTLGLPGLASDVWLEPLGILSLMVESAFIVLFVRSRRGAGPRDGSSASGTAA
ncbi:MAG TPA: hypothetical protein VEU73_05265 [Gemmatimonadales bacterium]|nr:hypothetical protein [Gemmatimonadales bacterium]